MLTLIALTACVSPEEGIDDSHITGTVTVPARSETEGSGKNDRASEARDLGDLGVGYLLVDGEIEDFPLHTDGSAGKNDLDWIAFTAQDSYDGVVLVSVGSASPPALPDTATDTSVVDTDTSVVDTDTSVVDTDTSVDTDTVDSSDTSWDTFVETGMTLEAPIVRVSIVDLTDAKNPVPVSDPVDVDLAGGEVPFTFEAGVRYGINVQGVLGDTATTWSLAVPGVHPDVAGVKVGAYQSSDPYALGAPVGGTTPRAFALNTDFSYTGEYEVVFLNSFTRDPVDTDVVEVNSDLPEVWLFAATWPNLNAGLRSGTFYSSVPAHVTLGDGSLYAADPLVLDAFAEALEGVTIAEEEPNDLDLDLDPLDFSVAQDLTGLSGAGYLDTITGTVTWSGTSSGTGAHDLDTYHVNVAQDAFLFGALGWEDGSDVDWYLMDATGETLDGAASYDNPEVGAGWLLSANTDYYVLVVGYTAEDPLVETPYAFTIEWGAP